MKTDLETFSHRLRATRWGVLLALVTTVFSFVLGGVFGGAEDALRGSLKASGEAVLAPIYGGDAAKLKAVLDKSWTYCKRAHLHGGAIGAVVLGALGLLAALRKPGAKVRGGIGLGLGVGGAGYSAFWLLAARAAPALGGTDLAKESLSWLAVPSAGLLLVGLGAVTVLTVVELFGAEPAAA